MTRRFVVVFSGLTAAGLVLAVMILRPNATPPGDGGVRQAGVSASALPPGHPAVRLPDKAVKLIAEIEGRARDNPKDLAAWERLGEVAKRAAMFDPAYYAKATDAYAHVLKLAPNDLAALRGIGDIDYDQARYDQAIATYEHYLSLKPDDPEVLTDLGTMYLSTGNQGEAEIEYRRALAAKPRFFQAYFNLGILYATQHDRDKALASLANALKNAPDEQVRSRVREMIAMVEGKESGPAGDEFAFASGEAAAGAPPLLAGLPQNFEQAVDQMVRNLPIAGRKVQAVRWPAKLKAAVIMDNFPMEAMPPFAKQRFLSDLKQGVDRAKKDFKVSAPVEIDLTDAASGRVMQSVTE